LFFAYIFLPLFTFLSFLSCYHLTVYQLSLYLFADECVADVSCGRNHTVCASASGRVFCWGDNTHSQCGISGLQIIVHPQCVPIVTHSDRNLIRVLSGSCDSTEKLSRDANRSHIDSSKSDLTGRMCCHPGCCHSSACHASQAGCSSLLVNVKIVHVSCGWTHTAVLSNTGKLWAWGTGSQVGVTDCISVPIPYPVEFPANRQVISVSCGGQHTVALTVRPEVNKFDAAAVSDTLKTGVSRTVRYTPGVGQNTGELIKLSNVPPEAKKGTARNSASNQEKTDVSTEKNQPVETVSNAIGVDIPMRSLASSSLTELGKDSEGTDCDAECELANTCIDDVFGVEATRSCDFPADTHSENSDNTTGQTDNRSCTESNVQNIPALMSSGASYTSSGSVPKSRSSFLDETEAIMFLEKQLSDTNSSGGITTAESKSGKDRNLVAKVDRKDVQDVTPSMSPFAKTVESLLQHVPSSPVVQEYVSNLTRTVVSNLRTSVDRRLNYVTSQVELSMRGIASLNKVAESCETEVVTALDDTALLERLALSSCVSSFFYYYYYYIRERWLITEGCIKHVVFYNVFLDS